MPPSKKPYPKLRDAKLKGKRVLLRAGFDVEIENGTVKDPFRIEILAPTMRCILKAGASLIVLAHQDRPKGKVVAAMSQKPLVPVLEKLLRKKVAFAESCIGKETAKRAESLKPGEVLLLENVRFDPREEKIDPSFAKELAGYGDIYVNDAFTNCHRNHTSMVEIAKLLPAYMGLQLEQEIEELSKVFDDPRRPIVLIVSGKKMETKVPVIERFLEKGDDILLGGAIANTFIAARGFDVGNSLYEAEYIDKAQEIMLESDKEEYANVHVPRDVVLATQPAEDAMKIDLPVEDIEGDMAIYDVGKVTIERYKRIIEKAGTIIWNGPLGLYEFNRFSHATKRIAEAIADATKKHTVTSIIGGGDTIDFHRRYGYPLGVYTFVSTGGGAMLDFLAGKTFPALEALRRSS